MSVTTYTEADQKQAIQPEGWAALARVLLEGVRDHATYLKEQARDEFRSELGGMLRTLNDSPSAGALNASAATLAERIPQYLSRTQMDFDNSLAELRQLASVLMSSLTQTGQTDQ